MPINKQLKKKKGTPKVKCQHAQIRSKYKTYKFNLK
jgi:hypothetical protein